MTIAPKTMTITTTIATIAEKIIDRGKTSDLIGTTIDRDIENQTPIPIGVTTVANDRKIFPLKTIGMKTIMIGSNSVFSVQ
jgi:hypothetical protein